MTQSGIELAEVGLPPIEVPAGERPAISPAEYETRLAALVAAVDADCVVVYGDREHPANLAYLCNFDPRFEEALLVLADGRRTLIVGKEGVVYTPIVPVPVDVVCCPTFSLMGIDRSGFPTLAEALRGAGLGSGRHVAVAGWKAVEPSETSGTFTPHFAPAFVVDTIRELAGDARLVTDATAVLTGAGGGQRTRSSADQIALFEWGASRCSSFTLTVIQASRPGTSEHAAFQAVPWGGEPFSYHPVLASGPDVAIGLRSATARRFERGDAAIVAIGLWGGNCARGGIVAASASDLLPASDGYLERLVVPYWRAMAAWYEALRVGARGGDVFATVTAELAGEAFTSSLNPGHLIHYEEWLDSPIRDGSDDTIESGMLLQADIIPTGLGAGWMTNCEDTIAIADASLRAEIADRHPELAARIAARRAFVRDRLGVDLAEDVLPLMPSALYLPPFWLSPQLAMARA